VTRVFVLVIALLFHLHLIKVAKLTKPTISDLSTTQNMSKIVSS